MGVSPLDPESSASTSSATSAGSDEQKNSRARKRLKTLSHAVFRYIFKFRYFRRTGPSRQMGRIFRGVQGSRSARIPWRAEAPAPAF